MGWWSTTIMGGDTPLDFECEFNERPETSTKKALGSITDIDKQIDEILNKWGCGKPGEDFYIDYKSIAFQVLAVQIMKHGASITEENKSLFIEWIKKDHWAEEREERKESIDNLIDTLTSYKGTIPVKIRSEGLFEVISDKFSKK